MKNPRSQQGRMLLDVSFYSSALWWLRTLSELGQGYWSLWLFREPPSFWCDGIANERANVRRSSGTFAFLCDDDFMKPKPEYVEGPEAWERFQKAMKRVVRVPHAEIQKRVEEHRQRGCAKSAQARP
jgi:hypothetical protein